MESIVALIACPECDKEVWSRAATCPSCAYPLDSWEETGETGRVQLWNRSGESAGAPVLTTSSETKLTALKKIATRVALGFPLFFSGVAYEAPPVIIISLLMGASCIPIWWKSRKEVKLAAVRGGVVSEDQLAGVVQELEERTHRQLEEIQERHLQQMTDLEERIDFAERLLTRRKDGV